MFADFNWMDAISSSPILILLIACSVMALGVVMERSLYFWRRSGTPRESLEKLLAQVRKGEIKEAIWTSRACAHPLGAAVAAVLEHRQASESAQEEQLHIALSEEKLVIEKNLGVLGSMAAVAPLVGLLGTVYGIMLAFHDMGATGSSAPSVVAAGVAEALLTTGAGLVVAVPCLVLYNQFLRRMSVMLTLAENGARRVRAALQERAAGPDRHEAPLRESKPMADRLPERAEIPVGAEL